MHNQEKGPVTLLYIILTPDHVGIKQTRLTPVYISSHMTLYLWAWEWNQSPALNIPSQSVSPNVTLFLLKSFTLKLMHTVWLPGWTEKIGEAIVKVMWCHESRFTLFLGDEHTVPWREVDKSVMQPPSLSSYLYLPYKPVEAVLWSGVASVSQV